VTAGGSGISASRSVVAFTMKCANWLGSLGLFGRAVLFVADFVVFLVAIPQVWHGVLKRLKREIFQSSPLPICRGSAKAPAPQKLCGIGRFRLRLSVRGRRCAGFHFAQSAHS